MIEDGVKISELTQTSITNDSDLIPIVQSDETKQISKLQLTRGINNYSGAETVCGNWFDGKPIYRKVIYIGQLPNASVKNVDHNISNFKRGIKITGYAYSSQSGNSVPIPYPSNSNVAQSIVVYCNSTVVGIVTGVDHSMFDECYVILEYTKTTD